MTPLSISPVLLIHIAGAVIGLLSGYLAMSLRKGSGWHSAAGNVFFGAMICMSLAGAYIAIFVRPIAINAVVALLTFYLVTTAWRTARARDARPGWFERGAFVFVLLDGVAAFGFGFQAINTTTGRLHGIPAPLYFIFGTIALLCAWSDFRMLRRGEFAGTRRISRHLWRMCLALLIASMSLYPGNAKLFPMWLRETRLLFIPHLFLLASMFYYGFRYRTRKRQQVRAQAEETLAAAA